MSDFEQSVDCILESVAARQGKREKAIARSLGQRAESAFAAGASKARRFSKLQALQEAVDRGDGRQGFPGLADGKLDYWGSYWGRRGHGVIGELPDAEEWEALLPLTGDGSRRAIRCLSWRAGCWNG